MNILLQLSPIAWAVIGIILINAAYLVLLFRHKITSKLSLVALTGGIGVLAAYFLCGAWLAYKEECSRSKVQYSKAFVKCFVANADRIVALKHRAHELASIDGHVAFPEFDMYREFRMGNGNPTHSFADQAQWRRSEVERITSDVADYEEVFHDLKREFLDMFPKTKKGVEELERRVGVNSVREN